MINDKKSKVLIGCLALLLVMAVGYALFSETITINGTATAKGDFDISFTCEILTSSNTIDDESDLITKGGTGLCNIEGQTITTTSSLTKPTDQVGYKVKLTNEGSIPAVLKTITSPNNCLNDSEYSPSCPGDEVYFDNTNKLAAGYIFAEFDETGLLAGAYEGDAATQAAKITLQSGDSINLYILHKWLNSGSATQPVLPADGASINYNITLGFEQVQAQ